MKIIHEKNKCIGCGACVALCPKMFEMDESGMAHLLNSTVNADTKNYELETDALACAKEAADSCPIEIIHVIEK
ncbi:MAG: ferredoxin [bacterium]